MLKDKDTFLVSNNKTTQKQVAKQKLIYCSFKLLTILMGLLVRQSRPFAQWWLICGSSHCHYPFTFIFLLCLTGEKVILPVHCAWSNFQYFKILFLPSGLPKPFLLFVPCPSPVYFRFFALCYPEMREVRQWKIFYQGTVGPHFHGIAFFRRRR